MKYLLPCGEILNSITKCFEQQQQQQKIENIVTKNQKRHFTSLRFYQVLSSRLLSLHQSNILLHILCYPLFLLIKAFDIFSLLTAARPIFSHSQTKYKSFSFLFLHLFRCEKVFVIQKLVRDNFYVYVNDENEKLKHILF